MKTRNLYQLLSKKYGTSEVSYIETYNWKKHPIKILCAIYHAVKQSENIIMLPAHNGVKIFTPLLLGFAKGTSVKLFYDVIGGWLPQKTKADKKLAARLRKFDGIWVETSKMKKSLNEQRFSNISVVPNFKLITPLTPEELPTVKKPYRLCTFSRVMEQKGIEDAIEAVIRINTELKKTIYMLDIYGPIDEPYQERFEILRMKFPAYIQYKGVIPPNESVSVLKGAFALLFPTHFFTEGIPGTLIDAYAAGIPVVAAKWENYDDVLDDGVTGWGYEMSDKQGLFSILSNIHQNTTEWELIRKNCLKKYAFFSVDEVFNFIQKQLIGNKV